MEVKIVGKSELSNKVAQFPINPVTLLLLHGDRIYCCDEAAVAFEDNQPVGIATFAPEGEECSGQPTIVGWYVLPKFRRSGYGLVVLQAMITRCVERGFYQLRVDVLSDKAMTGINKLPDNLKQVLQINYQGNFISEWIESDLGN